jgi:hypothetical protein
MGALVDTDDMRAIGPVGVGENARAELQQFVDTMPEAFMESDTFTLCRAWAQFWDTEFSALYEVPKQGDNSADQSYGDTDDNAAARAEHEATESAGEPPAPAPHDTDMEADESTADTVRNDTTPAEENAEELPPAIVPLTGACFNCNGSGRLADTEGNLTVTCGVCNGTGQLPAVEAT